MRDGFTQKLRQSAIEIGEFNVNDLAQKIPVYTYRDKHKITRVISVLKKQGEIISIKKGYYRYQEKKRPLSKQARIWRAIRIKEYFTRRDIAKLSGASDVYLRRYLNFLKGEGFIEHITGWGYKNALYRLIDPTTAPLEKPLFNSNHKAKQERR